MEQNSKSGILTWLLWGPLKFMVAAFIISAIVMSACALIAGPTGWNNMAVPCCALASLVIAGVLVIRASPRDDLSRHLFVAIMNAQTLLLAVLFFIPMSIADNNPSTIPYWIMSYHNNISVILLAGLFFMYITGLYLFYAYVKFRRARTIGIPAWKIICSMPFGFAMTWIPGYFLPDAPATIHKNNNSSNTYNRITSWILARPITSIVAFAIVTMLANSYPLLTFGLAAVFGIWVMRTGIDTFKKNIAGTYSTCAIAVNIATLIIIIWIGITSAWAKNLQPATPAAPEQITITSIHPGE